MCTENRSVCVPIPFHGSILTRKPPRTSLFSAFLKNVRCLLFSPTPSTLPISLCFSPAPASASSPFLASAVSDFSWVFQLLPNSLQVTNNTQNSRGYVSARQLSP
ncbi:unnamed protein product [Prunus armeniaca]